MNPTNHRRVNDRHIIRHVQQNERTGQQEHGEIPLLLQLRTPIPCARQTPIDTTPRIEKVVGPGTVETMPEEIGEDVSHTVFDRTELVFDVGTQRRFVRESGYL